VNAGRIVPDRVRPPAEIERHLTHRLLGNPPAQARSTLVPHAHDRLDEPREDGGASVSQSPTLPLSDGGPPSVATATHQCKYARSAQRRRPRRSPPPLPTVLANRSGACRHESMTLQRSSFSFFSYHLSRNSSRQRLFEAANHQDILRLTPTTTRSRASLSCDRRLILRHLPCGTFAFTRKRDHLVGCAASIEHRRRTRERRLVCYNSAQR